MGAHDKAEILTRLRQHIARIEGDASRLIAVDPGYPSADAAISAGPAVVEKGHAPVPVPARGMVALGLAEIDRRLPGRGLALGRLHEVVGAIEGAGTGFVVHLLRRLLAQERRRTGVGGPVLWCAPGCSLYAPGLVDRGLDVDRLVVVTAPRREDRLWAMEESLRIPGVLAVVGELQGREGVDLTASRRLQLAAGQGGALALLLRPPPPGLAPPCEGEAAEEETDGLVLGASAAATRWHVRGAAAVADADDDSDGADMGRRSRWRLALVRSRTGARHRWIVEVDHATGDLALAAPLRDRSGASGRAVA